MITRIKISDLRSAVSSSARGAIDSVINTYIRDEIERIKKEAHEKVETLFERIGARVAQDMIGDVTIFLESPDPSLQTDFSPAACSAHDAEGVGRECA